MRKELGIPLNATALLSVGELNRNKNHQIVIQALPELENVYYVICGQGPWTERLRALAEEKGVGGRLILPGYRTDVKRFYWMADAFVFPSFREGLPVSLMEAIASGLPVACSNARGNTELIRNPAYIFSPTDVRSVARCLKSLLSGENAEAVRENFQGLQKFSLRNVLERMESVYGSVAPEREKTRPLS